MKVEALVNQVSDRTTDTPSEEMARTVRFLHARAFDRYDIIPLFVVPMAGS